MKKNPLWLWSLPPLFLILLWVYWPQGQDEKALRMTMEQMLSCANRGDHLGMKKYLSPECEAAVAEFSLTPEQALLSVQRFDREDRAEYGVRAVTEFRAGSYALVELERKSGVNSSTRSFFIPLRYQHSRWQVAGDYQGGTNSWEEIMDLFN